MSFLNRITPTVDVTASSATSMPDQIGENTPTFQHHLDNVDENLQKRLGASFELLINPDPDEEKKDRPSKKKAAFKKSASSKLSQLILQLQVLTKKQLLEETRGLKSVELVSGKDTILINYLYRKACESAPATPAKEIKPSLKNPLFKTNPLH